MSIKYRWLLPNEYGIMKEVFDQYEAELPNPSLSAVCAAFTDTDQLVGFHVLQLVPHAEPMWIHPDYRAKVNWREFQRQIEGLFEESGGAYYIFPSNERVAALCKRSGMTEIPIKAWRRDL